MALFCGNCGGKCGLLDRIGFFRVSSKRCEIFLIFVHCKISV